MPCRCIPVYTIPRRFFSGIIRPLGGASLGRFVPWTMRSLNDASRERCVPWTMRHLEDASLGRCVLDIRDRFVPRLDRICRWWIITKAGRRKLGFTPDAMGANRGIPRFADITGHTDYIKLVSPVLYSPTKPIKTLPQTQGITKRCRLSWLTNSALVYEPNAGGWGRVAGSQPMSTAVYMEPK
jgi:hypothetical protein